MLRHSEDLRLQYWEWVPVWKIMHLTLFITVFITKFSSEKKSSLGHKKKQLPLKKREETTSTSYYGTIVMCWAFLTYDFYLRTSHYSRKLLHKLKPADQQFVRIRNKPNTKVSSAFAHRHLQWSGVGISRQVQKTPFTTRLLFKLPCSFDFSVVNTCKYLRVSHIKHYLSQLQTTILNSTRIILNCFSSTSIST